MLLSNQALIFKYAPDTDTQSSYFVPDSDEAATALAWLHDTDVFLCSKQASTTNMILARFNFTSFTYSWYKTLNCSENT